MKIIKFTLSHAVLLFASVGTNADCDKTSINGNVCRAVVSAINNESCKGFADASPEKYFCKEFRSAFHYEKCEESDHCQAALSFRRNQCTDIADKDQAKTDHMKLICNTLTYAEHGGICENLAVLTTNYKEIKSKELAGICEGYQITLGINSAIGNALDIKAKILKISSNLAIYLDTRHMDKNLVNRPVIFKRKLPNHNQEFVQPSRLDLYLIDLRSRIPLPICEEDCIGEGGRTVSIKVMPGESKKMEEFLGSELSDAFTEKLELIDGLKFRYPVFLANGQMEQMNPSSIPNKILLGSPIEFLRNKAVVGEIITNCGGLTYIYNALAYAGEITADNLLKYKTSPYRINIAPKERGAHAFISSMKDKTFNNAMFLAKRKAGPGWVGLGSDGVYIASIEQWIEFLIHNLKIDMASGRFTAQEIEAIKTHYLLSKQSWGVYVVVDNVALDDALTNEQIFAVETGFVPLELKTFHMFKFIAEIAMESLLKSGK